MEIKKRSYPNGIRPLVKISFEELSEGYKITVAFQLIFFVNASLKNISVATAHIFVLDYKSTILYNFNR